MDANPNWCGGTPILVDEKRWISEERFLHALDHGWPSRPEAQQLATFVALHPWRGAS